MQPPLGPQEILVTTETLGDDQDLDGYSLVVDGTGIKQLSSFPPECGTNPPNWSPDGRWMVFHAS